jgi:DNA polymerase III epsilon subunit-like protein
MTKLAFVDTETTGLDPDLHEIWEAAVIVREEDGQEHEHKWFLPVDLGRADPFALKIGGFHERYGRWPARTITEDGGVRGIPAKEFQVSHLPRFCAQFAKWTRGAHLVGAVISFDEERLRRLLKANRACPEWHYHLIDVEGLAVGYLNGKAAWDGGQWKSWHKSDELRPPWDSKELSRALGVDPDQFEEHTALGDARWAKAMYDAVMGAEW